MALIRGGSRDLRVDFFRGLALWWIFTDHIPGDVLEQWSLRNWALCDAAEVFVLLAGYGAGLAYGSELRRSGFLMAAASVVKRAWTLYIAHIFLFVVFSAQVGYSAVALARANYLDEANLDVLAHQPYQALLEALVLRYQPSLLNILPLYVVLLLLFVPALALLRYPRLLASLSFGLYIIARLGLNLPSWTGGGWFFDPFAWQFLFIGGALLATQEVRLPIPAWILDAAAGITIAFGLAVIYLVWQHPRTGFLLPLPVVHELLSIDKTTLDPLRLTSIAALLWAVARLIPIDARWLRSWLAAPVVLMGQHSLPVFCWSIFIGFFGRVGLEWRGGPLMQFLVNAGGLAAMVGVAAVAAWYSERGRGGRPASATPVPPSSAKSALSVGFVRGSLLVLALAFLIVRPAAAAPELCPPDAELTAAPVRFDAFAAAVRAGGPVAILAIGSASTAAAGGSYPRVMVEALQAALPQTDLQLTVDAARGLSAADMLARLPKALEDKRVKLVLWQTGTVEAAQGLRPEELAQTLEQGAAMITAAGANLVLIDFQYSRFLSANADLTPYELAFERSATLPGVALFHRYALMRSWADAGKLDMEMMPAAKRPETATLLHACLGQALARFVLSGIEAEPATH